MIIRSKKNRVLFMGMLCLCVFVISGICVGQQADSRRKWKFDTNLVIDGISPPIVGKNGTVYFVCREESGPNVVYALDPGGVEKWRFNIIGSARLAEICLGGNQSLYVGSRQSLYSLAPDGSLNWTIDLGANFQSMSMSMSGAVIVNTAYYKSAKTLNTVNIIDPEGRINWSSDPKEYIANFQSVGLDGSLFTVGDGLLSAHDPLGNERWVFSVGGIENPPTISEDGTVIVSSTYGYVFALDPKGPEKYSMNPYGMIIGMQYLGPHSPQATSIGPDGTLYFGQTSAEDESNYAFWAFSATGARLWKYKPGGDISTAPLVGADGTVYFTCHDNNLYAIGHKGRLNWKVKLASSLSSPAIGPDGTIYVSSLNGCLYAVASDSPGIADSPWPKYRRDSGCTGNAQVEVYSGPFGYVEELEEREIYVGDTIEFSGWAISLSGILRVDIYGNNKHLGEAVLGLPRDDIYEIFPRYNNRNSGFRFTWNVKNVERGQYTIEIIAMNTLGATISLGTKEVVIFSW